MEAISEHGPNKALHLTAKSAASIVALLLAADELGRYQLPGL
jgi:hypothetical protein